MRANVTATVVDVPQHERARAAANERRLGVAAILDELRRGEVSLAEALRSPAAEPVRLYRLLLAAPRCGETHLRQLLNGAGARCGARWTLPLRRIGELTARQRAAIIDEAISVLGADVAVGAEEAVA